MWKLKSCPKCKGDLFVDWDMNGWYEQCLQCGYLRDLETILQVEEYQPDKKREPVLAGRHKKPLAD